MIRMVILLMMRMVILILIRSQPSFDRRRRNSHSWTGYSIDDSRVDKYDF